MCVLLQDEAESIMKIYLFVVAVGCLASQGFSQDCPENCTCSDGELSVARCSHLSLEMFFPERVKHLIVESVPNIQINLTKSFFRNIGLQQVLSVKITNSSISFIDTTAFEGLQQLTDVNLSDNRLILIHPDTFHNNSRLQNLVLSGNPLQLTQLLKTDEDYFLKSLSLVELDLSRCQLSDIGKKLLSQVPNIQYINLRSNNIKVIDEYIFENAPLLDEVDLSYNELIVLNDEIFEDIEELTTLNLQHNLIENIDDLDLPGLKELDVSYNKIKLLRKNTFEGIPDLSNLNISYNEIAWISEETFKDLIELRHLDLSHNSLVGPLPKFIFEDNEFLETLKLGGNEEMHIFEGFSTELPRLYLLDISNCGITTMANTSFNGMPSLAILNMSMNSLTTLNHVIMSKLHRLNDLDVSYNNMNKVGTYTFSSNSHLRKLDLSNNRIHHLSPNTFETTLYLAHLDISNNMFSYIWHLNESQYMKDNKFLGQLEYLNIAGNKIKELHKLSFSHLTNLKAINVLRNPLECTTEFPAFVEWLYTNHILPLNFIGKSAKQVHKLEELENSNLQWDDLLTDVCNTISDKVDVQTKPTEGINEQKTDHDLNFYQYTVIEDVKLTEPLNEVKVSNVSTEEKDVIADEITTYLWPTFLIVFSLVFITLAVGNTLALLMYRHRNPYAPNLFVAPFKRPVVKLDTTPRYHKLYEECSVPNTPIVKNNVLGNLVSSQINCSVLLKSNKNDDVV